MTTDFRLLDLDSRSYGIFRKDELIGHVGKWGITLRPRKSLTYIELKDCLAIMEKEVIKK